jgi:hypothetical protein
MKEEAWRRADFEAFGLALVRQSFSLVTMPTAQVLPAPPPPYLLCKTAAKGAGSESCALEIVRVCEWLSGQVKGLPNP